ncbi:1,4-dihydroxy-6-naphtoate synthase [Desulfuromonas versatilis]|uniref:1,4-dihydroxy-6-naphtoate synthase n=1 Tax=Desulfuromonas versatilis TaxID=2802975 RepID=A0ABM8HRJ1_9BACT|nr:1,4-dihydroxy-6-naphthoate synthase [Desulfuromonas versatilis]BCR03058.1 1,4-dihydroxy-6-naphtoate synthase [Desulfuromonas versatilis]
MTRTLSLGYSPCPNDTFIFYALVHGRIPLEGIQLRERLEDVETLNRLALDAVLDLTKISYHALGHLRRDYALLRSGGALGRGCGPLVVTRQAASMEALRGCTIAIPGELTTANLLLQLYGAGYENTSIMPFDRIMAAVQRGEVDAGVIIHESRFTFPSYGLVQVADLGAWWERETGHPIPLGGILARRSLGPELISRIDGAIRSSIEYAFAHPEETKGYIKRHSQELSDPVIESHIGLYVNEFSLDLGVAGQAAIEELFQRAERRGIIPSCQLPLFVD